RPSTRTAPATNASAPKLRRNADPYRSGGQGRDADRRVRRRRPVDEVHDEAEGDGELSVRAEPAVAALPWRTRAAPLSERRGTLHRLQAVRGHLPGPGHHHRGRT